MVQLSAKSAIFYFVCSKREACVHVVMFSICSLLHACSTSRWQYPIKSVYNHLLDRIEEIQVQRQAGLATAGCSLKRVVMIAVVVQGRLGQVNLLITAELNLSHKPPLEPGLCKPVHQAITSNFNFTWDAL